MSSTVPYVQNLFGAVGALFPHRGIIVVQGTAAHQVCLECYVPVGPTNPSEFPNGLFIIDPRDPCAGMGIYDRRGCNEDLEAAERGRLAHRHYAIEFIDFGDGGHSDLAPLLDRLIEQCGPTEPVHAFRRYGGFRAVVRFDPSVHSNSRWFSM